MHLFTCTLPRHPSPEYTRVRGTVRPRHRAQHRLPDPLSASGSGEAPATGSPVPQPVPHAEEAPEEAPSPLGRPGALQTAPELELEAMTTSRDWQQQADADLRA